MAGPTYIADPGSLIRKVELDGLVALFHRPSGMTHIVAPPAPQILEALASGPADLRELAKRLADRFDTEGDEDGLQARLDELQAAGLVWRP